MSVSEKSEPERDLWCVLDSEKASKMVAEFVKIACEQKRDFRYPSHTESMVSASRTPPKSIKNGLKKDSKTEHFKMHQF